MASGSAFGSSGYRPDKGNMKEMFSGLQSGYGGTQQFEPTYYYNGKQIDAKQADLLNKWGHGDKVTTKQPEYQSNKPSFTYKPGESGFNTSQRGGTYNAYASKLGTGNPNTDYGTTKYNPFQYKSTDNYSSGLESSAYEGMKSALNQASESNKSSMGSRGMLGSGQQNEATGNLALSAGQGLVDQLRNIKQQAQQAEFQREQAQAGENQYAANLGENQRQYNLGFGENQRQFGANFGEQQAARKLQEQLAQYQLDSASRAEKYGYWKDPYNDMLKLYLGSLGSASQNQPSQIGNILGGTGSLLGGIGAL